MINYYSINKEIMNSIEINKSKFITYLFPISNQEEFSMRLNDLRKEHPKANHHCSAYILGHQQDQQKANDDGEPSGTAGYPMLDVLKTNNLTNIAAIVVRYFGGIKLGSGGLIRAYSTSVSGALNVAQKTANVNQAIFELTIPYQNNDVFQYFLGQTDLMIQELSVQYTDKVTYHIGLYEEDIETFSQEMNQRLNGNFQMQFIQIKAINIFIE